MNQKEEQNFHNQFGLGILERYNADKEKNQLQTGIDPTTLGLDFNQQGLYKKFLSPFCESTNIPDPLNPSAQVQNLKNFQKKREHFERFPEETHIYIFYNMPDEEQQMQAVECLYKKGWFYHYHYETWFKDFQEQGPNLYSCKYFDIQKWGVREIPEIKINRQEDLCTLEEFMQLNKQ